MDDGYMGGNAGMSVPVDLADRSLRSAAGIRERAPGISPRVGLVLGSGLGGLAHRFEDAVSIPYDEIDGFPVPGVAGHAGQLVIGNLEGVPCVGLRGRAHLYEGHPAWRATYPVRVLADLGIRALFLSNAAGAINPAFVPGDLMAIRDHLNLTGTNPLIGPSLPGEPRFPDMTEAWDAQLLLALRQASEKTGVPLHEGVYAGLLGPSFETPAEIRMLGTLGADAVGMSTVPELIVARARGLRCFGVSCLTNYAAGIGDEPLDHEEVISTTDRVAHSFQRLVAAAVTAADRHLTDAPSG
jgi:purine-nucleoside phosphorylase